MIRNCIGERSGMIMADSFLLNLNNKLIPLYNGLVLFYKGLDNLQSPLQLIHGPRRTGGQPDGGKLCGIPHSKTVGAEHLHAMVLCLDFKIIAAAACREWEPLEEAVWVCGRLLRKVSGVQAVAFL